MASKLPSEDDDAVELLVEDDELALLVLSVGAPVGGGPVGAPDGGDPPPWPPFGPPLAFELDNIARKAATAADSVVDAPASLEEVEVVAEEASDVDVGTAASPASVGAAVA